MKEKCKIYVKLEKLKEKIKWVHKRRKVKFTA